MPGQVARLGVIALGLLLASACGPAPVGRAGGGEQRPADRWEPDGLSNPDLDRLVDGYLTALDRAERIEELAQAEQVAMEQVPSIPTYWTAVVTAHASSLKGVVHNLVPEASETRQMWTWEWDSWIRPSRPSRLTFGNYNHPHCS